MARGCNIHDNLIAGFDTAIEARMASQFKLRDNFVDADVGIYMTDTHSPIQLVGFAMQGLITGFDDTFPINNIVKDTSNGRCKIYITVGASSSDPATGFPIDIAGVQGPVNCNGRTVLTTVVQHDVGGDYFEVATPYDPPSSTSGTAVSSTWYGGSLVATVASTAGIQPGLTISCSGSCTGFPSSASVVDVSTYVAYGGSPGSGKIVVSVPMTAAGSGQLNFGNAGFHGTGANAYLYTSLRPWAGNSEGGQGTYGYYSGTHRGTGTCLQVGNSSTSGDPDTADSIGVLAINMSCYGHEIEYAWTGAGPGGCVNCFTDSHAEIDDLGQIALLVRGLSGRLGFSNLPLEAGGSVVIDNQGPNCVNLSDININPHTSGALALEVVNGCFTASAITNVTSDFAADTLLDAGAVKPVNGTFTGFDAPNSSLYDENPVTAASVACIANLFVSQNCTNSLPNNLTVTGAAPSCGAGCGSIAGTNNAMSVTTTTAGAVASAQVNFAGGGFGNAPNCVLSRTSTSPVRAALTAVAKDHIVIGYSILVTSEVDNVVCVGH